MNERWDYYFGMKQNNRLAQTQLDRNLFIKYDKMFD